MAGEGRPTYFTDLITRLWGEDEDLDRLMVVHKATPYVKSAIGEYEVNTGIGVLERVIIFPVADAVIGLYDAIDDTNSASTLLVPLITLPAALTEKSPFFLEVGAEFLLGVHLSISVAGAGVGVYTVSGN